MTEAEDKVLAEILDDAEMEYPDAIYEIPELADVPARAGKVTALITAIVKRLHAAENRLAALEEMTLWKDKCITCGNSRASHPFRHPFRLS